MEIRQFSVEEINTPTWLRNSCYIHFMFCLDDCRCIGTLLSERRKYVFKKQKPFLEVKFYLIIICKWTHLLKEIRIKHFALFFGKSYRSRLFYLLFKNNLNKWVMMTIYRSTDYHWHLWMSANVCFYKCMHVENVHGTEQNRTKQKYMSVKVK